MADSDYTSQTSACYKTRLDIVPAKGTAAQALAFVEESLDAAQVPAKQKNRLMVAFDDMYANIVSYSGATHAAVLVLGDDAKATIVLRDNGLPFNPLAAEDPDTALPASQRIEGGLGIYMMKKMMDEVEYVRDGDENVLSMSSFVSKIVIRGRAHEKKSSPIRR